MVFTAATAAAIAAVAAVILYVASISMEQRWPEGLNAVAAQKAYKVS